MKAILGRFTEETYALMRIITGFLFLAHGAQKLFGVLGADGTAEVMSKYWVAGVIEFFGGLAVMLGLFTSVAAFLCSGTMAAAYFMAHASGGFHPIVNRGELAVLYSFVFLYLAAMGDGKWSLGGAFGKK